MKNFKRKPSEKPYYYASSVKNGKVIYHEGDLKHAIYLSEIKESTKRANKWHKWVEKNYKNAYNSIGVLNEDVAVKNNHIMNQFMDGLRNK